MFIDVFWFKERSYSWIPRDHALILTFALVRVKVVRSNINAAAICAQ